MRHRLLDISFLILGVVLREVGAAAVSAYPQLADSSGTSACNAPLVAMFYPQHSVVGINLTSLNFGEVPDSGNDMTACHIFPDPLKAALVFGGFRCWMFENRCDSAGEALDARTGGPVAFWEQSEEDTRQFIAAKCMRGSAGLAEIEKNSNIADEEVVHVDLAAMRHGSASLETRDRSSVSGNEADYHVMKTDDGVFNKPNPPLSKKESTNSHLSAAAGNEAVTLYTKPNLQGDHFSAEENKCIAPPGTNRIRSAHVHKPFACLFYEDATCSSGGTGITFFKNATNKDIEWKDMNIWDSRFKSALCKKNRYRTTHSQAPSLPKRQDAFPAIEIFSEPQYKGFSMINLPGTCVKYWQDAPIRSLIVYKPAFCILVRNHDCRLAGSEIHYYPVDAAKDTVKWDDLKALNGSFRSAFCMPENWRGEGGRKGVPAWVGRGV